MRHNAALPKSHIIYTITVIGFIYTIHLVLPLYSNASFLSLFVSSENVGLIYMIGSALTILGLLVVPHFIRKIGNYTTALWLIILEAILMYGLIMADDPRVIALCFALQMATVALIGLNLDVFLEVYSQTKNVGAIRGMYLTVENCAWVITPLIGSLLIDGGDNYRAVYFAAILILIPLFYMVWKNFPRFKDPRYHHPTMFQTFTHVSKSRDHSRLFIINIILQTFYGWMTVFSAIYLHMNIGLDWTAIGIILTIMLLPFPIVQLPLGRLADKEYGEKEIMGTGFVILGIATCVLSLIVTKNPLVWAVVLFMSRVGAAAAEVMIETYFFKTVDARDPTILGFFRVTRSISYFTAPLLAGIVFFFTPSFSVQFVVLGIMCLTTLIPIVGLKDTK